jgi:hypothetical protein
LEKVFGPLAQLVEQLTLNQLVVGSIPTRPTKFMNNFSSLQKAVLKDISVLPP